MPWIIWLLVFTGLIYFMWRKRVGGGAGAANLFSLGKSRGRLLSDDERQVTFDDVAGVEGPKEELQEIIDFLKEPDKYRQLGAKIPRGVLLVGRPGTGKTLLARAVAGEAEVPFIACSGAEFMGILVGVGVSRIRDLFTQATRVAPCIVFIDELDALAKSRGGPGSISNDDREQTVNQLLVQMDGFTDGGTVIVMGATNRPEILDPALMRPGRFDRHILVDAPDRAGREAILRVHSRTVRLADNVDLNALARRTPGFSGADLAHLINEAALLSARTGRERVDMVAFSDAIDRVVAGLKKKNRLLSSDELQRVAYHEVGHALASTLVGADERVHKISIVPRGMSALGFTLQMPDEERYLATKKEMEAKLVGVLGGRAAEEVALGEPSTGAQNDLERATALARAMVVDYGMSEAVGPITVRGGGRPMLLGGKDGEVGISREVGDQLADTIDREVRRIVEEALDTARGVLEANRESLDRIARSLLEHETLEGDALDALLDAAREAHAARVN